MEKNCFLSCSIAAGEEVEVDGREITVITPESPVGAALLDKKQGAAYSFRPGEEGEIRRVE